ncbi:Zinc finger protein 510 [Manis javanica]|nr:Zinc finger protein 510 [Manis javanica]
MGDPETERVPPDGGCVRYAFAGLSALPRTTENEQIPGPSLAASTLFQEQQKMHDSQKCVCQVSMSFKDVTVSFTRDEWLQLTGTQRTLYQDVMLENYSHLVFVEAPVSQQLLRSLTSYLPWRVLRHQTRGDLQVGARRALATRGRIPRSS